MNIRIGKTPYLNAVPFYYGFNKIDESINIELVEASPSELNQYIREGKVDISLVSSLEYGKAHENYLVFPELSISASEASQSVGLVWKGRIEDLSGKEIFFVRASLSSVALLDILLKERFEIKNFTLSPARENEVDQIINEGGPLLTIGDHALIMRHRLENSDVHFYDLGTLWWEWFKKPFCFALWIVRKDFYAQKPEIVRRVLAILKEGVKKNLRGLDPILQTLKPLNGISSKEYMKNYLLNFDYGLKPEIIQGLFLFYERAAKLGWSGRIKNLEFVS